MDRSKQRGDRTPVQQAGPESLCISLGNGACNSACPHCITRQFEYRPSRPQLPVLSSHPNFRLLERLVFSGRLSRLWFSSTGETTLFPWEVSHFLKRLWPVSGVARLLQTNGLLIGRSLAGMQNGPLNLSAPLIVWRRLGLDTIVISVVSIRSEVNAAVYSAPYPPLETTISRLRSRGYQVELTLALADGLTDSLRKVRRAIRWARENAVQHVTLRPVMAHPAAQPNAVTRYARQHQLPQRILEALYDRFPATGSFVSLRRGSIGPDRWDEADMFVYRSLTGQLYRHWVRREPITAANLSKYLP